MRVTLPDDVCDAYLAYATAQNRPLDTIIADQLKRFSTLEPGKRAVVIKGDALIDLEGSLGGLPIQSGKDLVDRAKRLAGISFERLNITLSPQQLLELEHRADRQGKTVAQLVTEMWRYLEGEFFHSAGGGEAKVAHPPLKKSPQAV